MSTKSNISVLALEYYMKEYIDNNDSDRWHKSLSPIFNRDGYYLDRIKNRCWFEYKGQARTDSPDQFRYRLKLLNHKILTEREVFAYKEIMRVNSDKKLTKQLFKILYVQEELINLRNIKNSWIINFRK